MTGGSFMNQRPVNRHTVIDDVRNQYAEVAKSSFSRDVSCSQAERSISDIGLKQPRPPNVKESVEAYVGYISGAILIEYYRKGC